MKHLHIITLSLLLTVAIFAPAHSDAAEPHLHEYLFKVGQFDKLRVLDNVNVVYRCVPDSSGYVAYHGSQDFCDAFIFTNSDGTLKIQVTTDDVGKPDLPTIYLYSDFLSLVENSSDFTTIVDSPAPCPKLKILQIENGNLRVENVKATEVEAAVVAGNGTIFISGVCTTANYRMVSAGTINADMLKADNVKCKVFGAGTIGCTALNTLKTRGLGSTKIFYKGDPVITKKGGGKLIPLP